MVLFFQRAKNSCNYNSTQSYKKLRLSCIKLFYTSEHEENPNRKRTEEQRSNYLAHRHPEGRKVPLPLEGSIGANPQRAFRLSGYLESQV